MTLPLAGRPDIVRANQKDESYQSLFLDALQDATRRLFGPRQAILWGRELDLVTRLVYAFMSTGSGQQTPGEEYCDILQVAGSNHTAPGRYRQILLSILEGCGPYIMEEIQISPDAARRDGPLWKLIIYMSQCLPWALRLQLAAFYLNGVYYEWSHRLTGTKYIFVGKLYEKRPTYRFLGILMCIQLAISAGSWAYSRANMQPAGSPDPDLASQPSSSQSLRKATVRKPMNEGPPPGKPSSQRCPLCLSPRDVPTATPCGHVFCWSCISSWSHQKPECPLCRSPFTGSDLVCLHYSDY